MISLTKYKDRPAILVKSSTLKATFLPLDGAKLVSLIRISDGKELLSTRPDSKYKVLAYDGDYVDSECSGFDDMFPTVDPFTPKSGPFKGVTYPDHGETCRIPYEVTFSQDELIMTAQSKIFPITYKKRVTAKDNGEIVLSYLIENKGDHDFPFLWAGHVMLQGEEGMKIVSPFDESVPTKMMFAPKGVDESALSLTGLSAFEPKTGSAYKFYYEKPMPNGVFGAQYKDGSSLLFTVDEKKLPYLGYWINNGEFQDIYTLTPEPCSVPYDSPERASEKGLTSIIKAQESFSFEIEITITEKQDYE